MARLPYHLILKLADYADRCSAFGCAGKLGLRNEWHAVVCSPCVEAFFCAAHVEKEMDRDNFKSAEDALKFGLIDEVIQKRALPDKPQP